MRIDSDQISRLPYACVLFELEIGLTSQPPQTFTLCSLDALGLRLPIIAAPMFLVSSVELTVAACRAGVIGSFPAANARTADDFDSWCGRIVAALTNESIHTPWAVNLIIHQTYARAAAELAIVQRYRPPVVITSLGNPAPVIAAVHEYGGSVLCDVSSLRLAHKAADNGADGLVLVCAGAGGHTGSLSPFAFIQAVRSFWSGPLVVGGGITSGAGVLAAQAAGADFAYLGTRFISAEESAASPAYREMLVASSADDLVASSAITGVTANWLAASLAAAGWTRERLKQTGEVNFGGNLTDGDKAWKNVWSAGHGVGHIRSVQSTAAIVAELGHEYQTARAELTRRTAPTDSTRSST